MSHHDSHIHGEPYGYCDGCDEPLYATGTRGRPRKYCEHCRPVQVQQGRRMPWEVDRAAVKRACDILGITDPVYVKRSPGKSTRGRYHGRYMGAKLHRLCDPAQDYHYITIAANATAEDASRTLWHELTHAAQHARDPKFMTKYGRISRKTGARGKSDSAHEAYKGIPYEIEARKNAGLHDSHGSLIVTVDSHRTTYISDAHTPNEIAKAQAEWDTWAADAVKSLELED